MSFWSFEPIWCVSQEILFRKQMDFSKELIQCLQRLNHVSSNGFITVNVPCQAWIFVKKEKTNKPNQKVNEMQIIPKFVVATQ